MSRSLLVLLLFSVVISVRADCNCTLLEGLLAAKERDLLSASADLHHLAQTSQDLQGALNDAHEDVRNYTAFLGAHRNGVYPERAYNTISANGKWPILVVYTMNPWTSSRLHAFFKNKQEAVDYLTKHNSHKWEMRDICNPLPNCEQIEVSEEYEPDTKRRTFSLQGTDEPASRPAVYVLLKKTRGREELVGVYLNYSDAATVALSYPSTSMDDPITYTLDIVVGRITL